MKNAIRVNLTQRSPKHVEMRGSVSKVHILEYKFFVITRLTKDGIVRAVIVFYQMKLYLILFFQMIAKYSDHKIEKLVANSRQREMPNEIILTFDHVSGAFFLWSVGITNAIIVFLLEILYHRFKKPKTNHRSVPSNQHPSMTVMDIPGSFD